MNLKESLRFLAKDSMFYGFATSVVKIAPLLIYPILNRVISKNGIGSLDIAMTNGAYFIILVTLGLDSGVARFYYATEDILQRKRVISVALLISIFASILLIILSPLFYTLAKRYLFNNDIEISNYWLIYLYSVPAQSIFLFSQNIFKYRFERYKFLVMTIGFTIVYISLFYVFIYVLLLRERSLLYSSLISYYVFAFLGLFMVRKLFDFSQLKTNKELIKKLLRFSLPFALVTLFSMLISYFDRIILFNNLGAGETSFYSNALKIASIFGLFISAFSISSGPFIMSEWNKPTFPQLISKILQLYLAITLILSVGFLFFKNFLIDFFCTSDYRASGSYIAILVFAQILEGLFIFSFMGINYAYKTMYVLYIYMFGAFFSIMLNIIIIPYLGIWGACISLILSKLLMIGFSFNISNRFLPLVFNKILLITLFLSSILISYFSCKGNNLLLSIMLILILILFYTIFYKQIKILIVKKLT